jgi:hypothetical protein
MADKKSPTNLERRTPETTDPQWSEPTETELEKVYKANAERTHLLCSFQETLDPDHPLRVRIEAAFRQLEELRTIPRPDPYTDPDRAEQWIAAHEALQLEMDDIARIARKMVQ